MNSRSGKVPDSVSFFSAGAFRRLVILGLDRNAVNLSRLAREMEIEVVLITGRRQMEALLADGRMAADVLSELKIEPATREGLTAEDPLLSAREDTLLFSASSPFIVHAWLIDRFKGRVVNSHGTRLPEWRGGGGHSWRIMAADRTGNSLIHLLTPGIDDGPIVFERAYEFPRDLRRPIDYINYTEKMDHELLGDFLGKVSHGFAFPLQYQDESVSTYFPRLNSERQGYIDWTWPGEAVERFILAFSTPYTGAKTFLREREVHIFDGHFVNGVQPHHPFFVGLVVRVFNGRLHVLVEGGQLDIALADTVGMNEIKAGDRLSTPRSFLDGAIALRPAYGPAGLKTKPV
jgi:methionyl-tRNA formyltransferase